MAEENPHPAVAGEAAVETKDRGLFERFLGKDEKEKREEEAIASDLEKVHVSEPDKPTEKEEKEKHSTLLEKLHRSNSSSSSSSDEEQGDGGEKKKKKKKGLKEKVSGEEEVKVEDTTVQIEKYEESEAPEGAEKKGLIEKIKEKLPGHNKKAEEHPPPAALESAAVEAGHEGEGKEKKGVFDKIKEKIPGYHKSE